MLHSARVVGMALEWAKELNKYKKPAQLKIVSEVTMWGFGEVERGRNPDVVLKEVVKKIEDRLDADRQNLPMQ